MIGLRQPRSQHRDGRNRRVRRQIIQDLTRLGLFAHRHSAEVHSSVARQALLVLGMHRSGTSALAGMLIRLGAAAPKTLMPSTAHNPRGHSESEPLFAFHERVLDSEGSRWSDWLPLDPIWLNASAETLSNELSRLLEQEFDAAPLFVVKDPRICRLVPFWLNTLVANAVAPVATITVRSPLEVAHSLGS